MASRAGMKGRGGDALEAWETSHRFDAQQCAVLQPTDTMTRDVHVPPEVFEAVRAFFDDRQVVELVATIAAYTWCRA